MAGRGTAGPRREPWSSPAPTGSWSRPRAGSARRRLADDVTARRPRVRPRSEPRRLDWRRRCPTLDVDRPSRSDAAARRRRPGRACGSSCRPTTRRRTSARWRRPSSASLPGATLLVVDDGSPDGTGDLADALAAADPAGPRPPPPRQAGPRAGPTSTASASRSPAARATVVQMDADFSHDPAALPALHRRRSPTGPPTWSSVRATRRAARSWTGASAGGSSRAAAACSPGSCSACRPERPDRRLQGVAGDDARRRPVRRRPCRRLRVPDRDDLPGEPGRGAHPRGARSPSATGGSASRR